MIWRTLLWWPVIFFGIPLAYMGVLLLAAYCLSFFITIPFTIMWLFLLIDAIVFNRGQDIGEFFIYIGPTIDAILRFINQWARWLILLGSTWAAVSFFIARGFAKEQLEKESHEKN